MLNLELQLLKVEQHIFQMSNLKLLLLKVSNDPSGKPPSTGLFVGCFIDAATGVVRYFIRA